MMDMRGWTDGQRFAYYEKEKLSFPFEVFTNGTEQPDPGLVDTLDKYGMFVRIPFPERGHTMWLFTARELAVMFQQDFKARM